MMRKSSFLVLLISIFLIAACAQTQIQEKNVLFEQFSSFRQMVHQGTHFDKAPFFSEKLFQALQRAQSQSTARRGMAKVFLNFLSEIETITGTDEVITGNSGCLLVMGLSSKQEPTDYMIRFIQQHGRWVFDEVQVLYYENRTKRYLTSAVCDENRQQQLWLEYMKKQH